MVSEELQPSYRLGSLCGCGMVGVLVAPLGFCAPPSGMAMPPSPVPALRWEPMAERGGEKGEPPGDPKAALPPLR